MKFYAYYLFDETPRLTLTPPILHHSAGLSSDFRWSTSSGTQHHPRPPPQSPPKHSHSLSLSMAISWHLWLIKGIQQPLVNKGDPNEFINQLILPWEPLIVSKRFHQNCAGALPHKGDILSQIPTFGGFGDLLLIVPLVMDGGGPCPNTSSQDLPKIFQESQNNRHIYRIDFYLFVHHAHKTASIMRYYEYQKTP